MKAFRLFAALMMAVVCVGLSSCSKDDDMKKNGNSLILGTWAEEPSVEQFIVTFKADGSGVWDCVSDGTKEEPNNFTYIFDSETMDLTIKWSDKDWEDTIDKVNINGNILKFDGDTFYKK